MPISEIIEQVLRENEFGPPWKWGDKAAGLLVPILRISTWLPREYKMLEEVKDQVNIEDTGHIGQAKLINKADGPVFVRGGGILGGQGTQSRAVQTGTIVQPGKQEIPVNCVHATHGIRPNASFFLQGYAPPKVTASLRSRNQSHVWNAVSDYGVQMRTSALQYPAMHNSLSAVASDDLATTVQTVSRFKGDVEDAIKRMPRADNQVGVAIFTLQGVVGVEVFDHPDSWKALCEHVIRQYGDVISEKVPDWLSIAMDQVVVNVRTFMEEAKESKEEPERNGTVVLHGKISGEYTCLKPRCDDNRMNAFVQSFGPRLIHLLLVKEEQVPQPLTGLGAILGTETIPRWTVTNPSPQPPYQTGDFPDTYRHTTNDFFTHTMATTFLSDLQKKPKTWKQLEPKFKSTHTLHDLANSAINLGLVKKNGNRVYTLTAKGHEELRKVKQTA